MPQTQLIIYQEANGTAPLIEWLKCQGKKVQNKCQAFIEHLAEHGRDVRRPQADILRDGIYELRPKRQGIQYRILYAFVGQQVVLLTHGFIKEDDKVDPAEINRAIEYRKKYEMNPELHTYKAEE